MGRARQWNLLRDRGGERRVTNMELFFDLVFVFAVTQLSQYLLQHRTVTGALKTGLLLTMVAAVGLHDLGDQLAGPWPDPGPAAAARPDADQPRNVRRAAAGLPRQRPSGGLRLRRHADRPQRIRRRRAARPAAAAQLPAHPGLVLRERRAGPSRRHRQRECARLLWLGAVAVDLLGGAAGFYTPGLGRSSTQEWDIEGGHVAERCQAFIL